PRGTARAALRLTGGPRLPAAIEVQLLGKGILALEAAQRHELPRLRRDGSVRVAEAVRRRRRRARGRVSATKGRRRDRLRRSRGGRGARLGRRGGRVRL